MLCLLALLTFAVLAVFSARFRPLVKEAVECVFRRVTLRKCTTGFDKQVRAALAGRLVLTHPRAARLLYRHVELLAWLFVALIAATTAYLAYGFYNYSRYGNCYGPVGKGFCVFDPSGVHSRYSGIRPRYRGPEVTPDAGDAPAIGPSSAAVSVIEFGSYTCPYTRESERTVQDVLNRHAGQVRFVYRHFPLDWLHGDAAPGMGMCGAADSAWPAPTAAALDAYAGATRAAIAATCARAQGRFWEFHRALCRRTDDGETCDGLRRIAIALGLDETQFADCLADAAARAAVERDFNAGEQAGLYGTPTFFVNGHRLVAPSPDELERAISRALESSRP